MSDTPLPPPTSVAAFYKFTRVDDSPALQRRLSQFCCARGVKGTILIAEEGINATVSGEAAAIDALLQTLKEDARFADIAVKRSLAAGHPFGRLKVKVKREIVSFGVPGLDPASTTGTLVEPQDWNDLICDPATLLIDTRNAYEADVGTFEGAINPRTRSFGEFRDFVTGELAAERKRKIAMFCTGGIRCEKASAYLISQGFTDVHQLSGGILRYLECIPPDESLWRGECFVFDGRVTLTHGVRQGRHGLCDRCGYPVPMDAGASNAPLCASCRGEPSHDGASA